MSDRVTGGRNGSAARTPPAEHLDESARAARSLGHAEAELGVVLREIPLDAIEPDPAQPRRTFDEEKLRSLAASIRKYGVLQEPGVVQVTGESAKGPARYRLIWGERRWRASQLAGLAAICCKVLPRSDDSAVEQLRMKERQWAENVEREGLSPIEEAIALQDAADLERKLQPDVAIGDLIEKVGAERGLHGSVARNLVALLKAPRALQSAMLSRTIGRELGFELARFWNRLLADNELRGAAKREIQYLAVVEGWARARGMDLDAQAMARYAAETFQDPKVVKATCRKAEESRRAVLARFDAIVARAQKESWTVGKAKAVLGERRRRAAGSGKTGEDRACFEHEGKRGTRLTIHLDRIRDPAAATPEQVATLLSMLRDLMREIESRGSPDSAALSPGGGTSVRVATPPTIDGEAAVS
jgi:ParB family chromosome partitioning protein